jgi:hypothetical protein
MVVIVSKAACRGERGGFGGLFGAMTVLLPRSKHVSDLNRNTSSPTQAASACDSELMQVRLMLPAIGAEIAADDVPRSGFGLR